MQTDIDKILWWQHWIAWWAWCKWAYTNDWLNPWWEYELLVVEVCIGCLESAQANLRGRVSDSLCKIHSRYSSCVDKVLVVVKENGIPLSGEASKQ